MLKPFRSTFLLFLYLTLHLILIDKCNSQLAFQIIFPANGSTIPLGTQNISIAYTEEIAPSAGNISIYQILPNSQLLRQSFSARSRFCHIQDDQKTLTIDVLTSTFNRPNATYSIVVDSDFIKRRQQKQPLPTTQWIVRTGTVTQGIYAPTFQGVLRLNLDGSTYFFSLSLKNRTSFLASIKSELETTIPTDDSQLSIPGQYQIGTGGRRILFSADILATTDLSNPSSYDIMNDFDTLIRNKQITQLSRNRLSSYLDKGFGYQYKSDLLDTLRSAAKYGCIAIAILIGTYWHGRRRFPEGRNAQFIFALLIVLDLLLDILFVITQASDIDFIFLPSVIIIAVSLALNTGLTVIIILKERRQNPECREWFGKHPVIVTIFELLSCIDCKGLKMLSSRYGGYELFSAPLSPSITGNWTFWGDIGNLLLKDIPQFVLQILYYEFSISYDLVPFLTLLTCGLILAISIVGRVYKATRRCLKKKREKVDPMERGKDYERVDVGVKENSS